jgi:hypothetical protein
VALEARAASPLPMQRAGDTRPGEPRLRVAFVGQGVYFRQCALELSAGGLEPAYVDFRAAAPPAPLEAKLGELDPDVVLVFRPEIIPPAMFAGRRALTIGYLTEPLPRTGRDGHPDLDARMWWLEQVDPENFDAIVCFDPLIAESAESVLPVWRSLALPVADSLFMNVQPRAYPPRLLFLGRSTEHREQLLAQVKREHPIVHIGHGLYGEALARVLRRTDVQLNLHNNPYPSFENRVCIALAAGHLVISEPLSPRHGLTPDVEYLEASGAEELRSLVARVTADAGAFAEVQHAGRRAAEQFRASRIYPQLIHDALAERKAGGGPVSD